MPIPDEFILQALNNLRDDVRRMEERLGRRIDEIRPQCQFHAERIGRLENWKARQTGTMAGIAAVVSMGLTFLGYALSAAANFLKGTWQ